MKIKRIIKFIRAIILSPVYRFYHSSVSVTSYIRKGTIPKNSIIGKYCWINKNVGMNKVQIGNYCSIASNVLIGGMEHPINKVSTSTLLNDPKDIISRTTYIGNNVWIGAHCVIKQGVKIGNGAVVGAHSFVNKDVPPYSIVIGAPAKVLRYRFDNHIIDNIEKSHFWEYSPLQAIQVIKKIDI